MTATTHKCKSIDAIIKYDTRENKKSTFRYVKQFVFVWMLISLSNRTACHSFSAYCYRMSHFYSRAYGNSPLRCHFIVIDIFRYIFGSISILGFMKQSKKTILLAFNHRY